MNIKLGKVSVEEKDCPRFLLSIHRKNISNNFFHIGRLYVGYVGFLITIKKLMSINLWIYKPQH